VKAERRPLLEVPEPLEKARDLGGRGAQGSAHGHQGGREIVSEGGGLRARIFPYGLGGWRPCGLLRERWGVLVFALWRGGVVG